MAKRKGRFKKGSPEAKRYMASIRRKKTTYTHKKRKKSRSSRKTKRQTKYYPTRMARRKKRRTTRRKGIFGGGMLTKVLIGGAGYVAYEKWISPMIPISGLTKNIGELVIGSFLARRPGVIGSVGTGMVWINAYQLMSGLMVGKLFGNKTNNQTNNSGLDVA